MVTILAHVCPWLPFSFIQKASPFSSTVDYDFTGNDESLNLLAQSFDTFTESSDYRIRDCGYLSVTPTVTNIRPSDVDRFAFRLDIPTLLHDSEAVSVGNISPIKVDLHQQGGDEVAEHPTVNGDYHGDTVQGREHRQIHDYSHLNHAGIIMDDKNTGATSLCHPSQSHVSNPFFVLRMCRGVFSRCTYVLDCLQQADLCTVNINVHGSFRLHRNGNEVCKKG